MTILYLAINCRRLTKHDSKWTTQKMGMAEKGHGRMGQLKRTSAEQHTLPAGGLSQGMLTAEGSPKPDQLFRDWSLSGMKCSDVQSKCGCKRGVP